MRLVAVVANCRRPGADWRPYISQRALLADPGFVLEPDFDVFAHGLRRQGIDYVGGEVLMAVSGALHADARGAHEHDVQRRATSAASPAAG